MKVIISHDIDHITVWEHASDLIIPKFIARTNIELLNGKISFSEYFNRVSDAFYNKWNNIDELISFNKQNNIPGTFFIGVNNGVGLSYPFAMSSYWAKKIANSGVEIGLHGISFETKESIKRELDLFASITANKSPGIRMHYVRTTENTYNYLDQNGFRYDCTENSFKNPYKIGNMWEFPFQIMDGWIIEKGRRWQTQNIEQAKESTMILIDKAQSENLKYLGIDFHDRYYSKSFKTWMDWYNWLIEYLKQNNFQFIDYAKAINELENVPV